MWPTLFDIPVFNIPIRGYGFMLMVAFLGGTWWAARRADRVKANPDIVINLAFISLLSSIVGARLFYVIHYWDTHFAGRDLWQVFNVAAGGLEFYGGFIAAVLAGTAYLLWKKVSFRMYMDISAPSVMFGMSMARIGCFLNGCCWGAPCPPELPWAVQFPYASPAFIREWDERQVAVPAELMMITSAGQAFPLSRDWLEEGSAGAADRDLLASHASRFQLQSHELRHLAEVREHRSLHVHPAQLYASVGGILLALLLNSYFYRRQRHGTVFGLLLVLYGGQRFVEESIRIDNPQDVAGLTVSQFVSLILILAGVAFLLWLTRGPERSPKAVPYVVPAPEPDQQRQRARSRR